MAEAAPGGPISRGPCTHLPSSPSYTSHHPLCRPLDTSCHTLMRGMMAADHMEAGRSTQTPGPHYLVSARPRSRCSSVSSAVHWPTWSSRARQWAASFTFMDVGTMLCSLSGRKARPHKPALRDAANAAATDPSAERQSHTSLRMYSPATVKNLDGEGPHYFIVDHTGAAFPESCGGTE